MSNNAKRIAGAATFLLLFLILLTGAGTGGHAQETPEYQVKAAYLFNFAKFVEWPDRAFAGPDAPFTICIIGDDLFGGALKALQAKTVKNRKVAVKRVSAPAETGGCQVLFIGPTEEDRLDELLLSLKGSTTLVVGDMERFARRGGMIGFLMERNKVVFEINDSAAKRAGLELSSQLLKMARTLY